MSAWKNIVKKKLSGLLLSTQLNWTVSHFIRISIQSYDRKRVFLRSEKKCVFTAFILWKSDKKKSSRTAIETNGTKSWAYFCLCFEMVNSFVKYYVVYTHVPKTLPLQEKDQTSSRACKSLRTNPKNECFYFSKNYI